MAAIISSSNNFPIDPSKVGKYPISISEELLREEGPRKRRRVGVQYNYKPKVIAGRKAIITASGGTGEGGKKGRGYEVLIKGDDDGIGDYGYSGCQRSSEALVLIYDAEKQSFVLDKIDAEFQFNLTSTPSNKDAASLASQHPQLDTTREPEVDRDDLFGDAEGDEEDPNDTPADPSNPYDYRHFLHRGASPSPDASAQSSPVPNHNFGLSPLHAPSSPANRPRSHTEPKKSSQVGRRYLSPVPPEEANRGNEESDPNELVIDMGDSITTTKKPWRSALGILNGGARHNGPISLRSAASSMSPSVRGESEDEEDDESDHDVEEIDIGEPGLNVVSREGQSEEVDTNGIESDDDDDGILEAELEQALEEQAENDLREQANGQIAAAAESSSESEEE